MSNRETSQWGPIPALAFAIGGGTGAILEELSHCGGLWGFQVRERLDPIVPDADQLDNCAKGPFWSRRRKPPRRRRLKVHWAPEDLVQCHAWLGERNLHGLMAWVSPFWRAVPMPVVEVTDRGIAWALVTYLLERRGPSPLPDAFLHQFALDGRDLLGDHLALHLMIETLAEGIVQSLGIDPACIGRHRVGGLRRREFISCYLALRVAELAGPASPWLAVLDQMMACSPLTRQVYADLVTGSMNSLQAVRDFDLKGEAAAVVPLIPSEGNSTGGVWREHWLALLAKSLLGATLSSTLQASLLEYASDRTGAIRDELLALEERRRSNPFAGLFQFRYFRNLREELARLQQTGLASNWAPLARLVALRACFGPYCAEDAGSAVHAMALAKCALQMRFLDLLVRIVTADSMDALCRLWAEWESSAVPHTLKRRRLLGGREGSLFGTVVELLLGCRPGNIAQTLQLSATNADGGPALSDQTWFLLQCTGFLNVGEAELESSEGRSRLAQLLSKAIDSGEQGVHRLVERFANDESGAVAVSFQPDDQGAYAPAYMLREWTDSLYREFNLEGSFDEPRAA